METFPVSEDFNRDPEVRELRRKFGDWMSLAWLDMIADAHKHGGHIKGNSEQIAVGLVHLSPYIYPKSGLKVVQKAFEFMSNLGWIRVNSNEIVVLNYAKYKESYKESAVKVAIAPKTRTERTNIVLKNKDSIVRSEKRSVRRGGDAKQKFPADFILTNDMTGFAKDKGVEDPAEEFSLFKDHHLSRGSQFSDWEAAWRTWVRRSDQFPKKRKNSTATKSTKYQHLNKEDQ